MCRSLLIREGAEAPAHDFAAVYHVHEGVRVKQAEIALELDEIGAAEIAVNHMPLLALVKPLAQDRGTAAVKFVYNEFADRFLALRYNENGLVRTEAVHNQVDQVALYGNDQDGIDREPHLFEGDERRECDATVHNHDQRAEAHLRVLVKDHAYDVAAAAGGSAPEDEADGKAVNDARENRIYHEVRHKPSPALRNLHPAAEFRRLGTDNLPGKNHGSVPPHGLQDPGEEENEDCGENRLEAESGAEDPGPDKKQRDVHADRIVGNAPRPYGIENVGKAVCTARGQMVWVHEHHVANGEKGAAENDKEIGYDFLPGFCRKVFHILNPFISDLYNNYL